MGRKKQQPGIIDRLNKIEEVLWEQAQMMGHDSKTRACVALLGLLEFRTKILDLVPPDDAAEKEIANLKARLKNSEQLAKDWQAISNDQNAALRYVASLPRDCGGEFAAKHLVVAINRRMTIPVDSREPLCPEKVHEMAADAGLE